MRGTFIIFILAFTEAKPRIISNQRQGSIEITGILLLKKNIAKTEYFVHGSAKLDSGIEINLTEFTNDLILQREILITQATHRLMKEPTNIMNSAHDYITKLICRKLPV